MQGEQRPTPARLGVRKLLTGPNDPNRFTVPNWRFGVIPPKVPNCVGVQASGLRGMPAVYGLVTVEVGICRTMKHSEFPVPAWVYGPSV